MCADCRVRQHFAKGPHHLCLISVISIDIVDSDQQSQVPLLMIQMEHRDVLLAADTQTFQVIKTDSPRGPISS